MNAHEWKLAVLLLCGALAAQASEWLTFGGDAQRTGCVKDEKVLTKESLAAALMLAETPVVFTIAPLTLLTGLLYLFFASRPGAAVHAN